MRASFFPQSQKMTFWWVNSRSVMNSLFGADVLAVVTDRLGPYYMVGRNLVSGRNLSNVDNGADGQKTQISPKTLGSQEW